MKSIYQSFALVLSLLLTAPACTPSYIKADLSLADKLMMNNPDSALHIIEMIDTGSVHSAAAMARYSLLHTMAIDRVGNDTTDYTLIRHASSYYQNHGPAIDRARAMFYEGRIFYNNGDYATAHNRFLSALSISADVEDEWLKGMICYYLAETYNTNRLKKDELDYSQQSYDHFCRYGNQDYIDYALCRLAIAFHNNKLYDDADSLYSLVSPTSSSYKYALLRRAANEVIRDRPDPKAALNYFEEAHRLGATYEISDYYQYAYALLLDGKEKEADRLLGRLDNVRTDVKAIWWKYYIARKRNHAEKALDYYEEYNQQRNTYLSQLLSQSLYRSETDYYSAIKEQAENRATILSLYLVLVATSFIIIVFTLTMIMTLKRRRLQDEKNTLTQRVNDIQELLDKMRENDNEAKEQLQKQTALQATFVSLYQEQFSEIGKLIGTNLDMSLLADSVQRRHLHFINGILNEITSDEGKSKRFEERINRTLDNIITRIRKDFPSLSEDSIRLMCYVIAGFKDPTIATIMNKSTSAVSTHKSRLKKQILSADTPNHESYAAFLK